MRKGGLLLDSVDEARLRDPKDFERAISKPGRLLPSMLQQAHIVITGRTTAWRPKTDLLLCQTALPYRPDENAADEEASSDKTQDIPVKKTNASRKPAGPFTIVALDDLRDAQIDAFLLGKKVQDSKGVARSVWRGR